MSKKAIVFIVILTSLFCLIVIDFRNKRINKKPQFPKKFSEIIEEGTTINKLFVTAEYQIDELNNTKRISREITDKDEIKALLENMEKFTLTYAKPVAVKGKHSYLEPIYGDGEPVDLLGTRSLRKDRLQNASLVFMGDNSKYKGVHVSISLNAIKKEYDIWVENMGKGDIGMIIETYKPLNKEVYEYIEKAYFEDK